MDPDRLFDCRPRPHDEGITSASSHPELLTGDLAMRPRIPIRLTPEEQATRALWSRRTLGACGLIVLAMIAVSGTHRGVDGTSLAAHAEMQASVQTCAQWHETASGAVSHLTQTMRDADL